MELRRHQVSARQLFGSQLCEVHGACTLALTAGTLRPRGVRPLRCTVRPNEGRAGGTPTRGRRGPISPGATPPAGLASGPRASLTSELDWYQNQTYTDSSPVVKDGAVPLDLSPEALGSPRGVFWSGSRLLPEGWIRSRCRIDCVGRTTRNRRSRPLTAL